MSLQVGSTIAHYQVTALIGEGGMGQVYQATDTKLNRQVAVTALIGEGGMGQVDQATDTKLNRQVALNILSEAVDSSYRLAIPARTREATQ